MLFCILNRYAEYRKLSPTYIGPFKIKKVINPNAYEIDFPLHYSVNPVVNIQYLKHYEGSQLTKADARAIRKQFIAPATDNLSLPHTNRLEDFTSDRSSTDHESGEEIDNTQNEEMDIESNRADSQTIDNSEPSVTTVNISNNGDSTISHQEENNYDKDYNPSDDHNTTINTLDSVTKETSSSQPEKTPLEPLDTEHTPNESLVQEPNQPEPSFHKTLLQETLSQAQSHSEQNHQEITDSNAAPRIIVQEMPLAFEKGQKPPTILLPESLAQSKLDSINPEDAPSTTARTQECTITSEGGELPLRTSPSLEGEDVVLRQSEGHVAVEKDDISPNVQNDDQISNEVINKENVGSNEDQRDAFKNRGRKPERELRRSKRRRSSIVDEELDFKRMRPAVKKAINLFLKSLRKVFK